MTITGPTTSATDLTAGTLGDARLSSNVALENSANVFVSGQRIGAGTGEFITEAAGSPLVVSNNGTTNLCVRDAANAVELFAYAYSGGGIYGTISNHQLVFRTNNVDRITVAAGGGVTIAGALAAASLSLGGATLLDVLTATAVEDVPDLANGVSHSFNITVTGAVAGDAVLLGLPAVTGIDALNIRFWCAGADTVSITIFNNSGGNIDLDSATWRAVVLKF